MTSCFQAELLSARPLVHSVFTPFGAILATVARLSEQVQRTIREKENDECLPRLPDVMDVRRWVVSNGDREEDFVCVCVCEKERGRCTKPEYNRKSKGRAEPLNLTLTLHLDEDSFAYLLILWLRHRRKNKK